ncbi:glycerophosphodiester phosphodiesterase family protein [Roseibium algae]|uniref:Glycerophosphodiester phosphodiesterase family protein n=1 Tax=Roseibium algae TaxID=3123038 RepID=A0ABU8TQP0_9HYPH
MNQISKLLSRPIAHRGFHNADDGVIENTPSAISAAVAGNFAIEVDVQETADTEALVYHDYTLDRLVQGSGPVFQQISSDLVKLPMKTGTDTLWLLQDLFNLVNGKVPLVIELKSRMVPGAQADFVRRVVDQVAGYNGLACIKSFDPDMISIARAHNPSVLRGIVAHGAHKGPDLLKFSRMERFIQRNMLHIPRTRPHFISYGIHDLPSSGPRFWRSVIGLPIMTWTVRTEQQRERAARYADQIVFEGFNPDA